MQNTGMAFSGLLHPCLSAKFRSWLFSVYLFGIAYSGQWHVGVWLLAAEGLWARQTLVLRNCMWAGDYDDGNWLSVCSMPGFSAQLW